MFYSAQLCFCEFLNSGGSDATSTPHSSVSRRGGMTSERWNRYGDNTPAFGLVYPCYSVPLTRAAAGFVWQPTGRSFTRPYVQWRDYEARQAGASGEEWGKLQGGAPRVDGKWFS